MSSGIKESDIFLVGPSGREGIELFPESSVTDTIGGQCIIEELSIAHWFGWVFNAKEIRCAYTHKDADDVVIDSSTASGERIFSTLSPRVFPYATFDLIGSTGIFFEWPVRFASADDYSAAKEAIASFFYAAPFGGGFFPFYYNYHFHIRRRDASFDNLSEVEWTLTDTTLTYIYANPDSGETYTYVFTITSKFFP